MTASLYQSGSATDSLVLPGMGLTLAAQSAPRNHPLTRPQERHLAGAGAKKSELNPGYPLTLAICDAMHCHSPPRFIQVSVKRKVRSNALPSLPVPFSRARPVTTIIFGPKALTFSFSFFADL